MRVVIAAEHEIEDPDHLRGDVAVKVEGRQQRRVGPDDRADFGTEVRFEVVDALHHSGTVRVENNGVDRHRCSNSRHQFGPHRTVRPGFDGARRLRVRVEDRYDLVANGVSFGEHSTYEGSGSPGPEHLLAASYDE